MKRPGLALAAIAFGATAIAVWLFPHAVPTIPLEQRITRAEALRAATLFIRAHDLAPRTARIAVRFSSDDSLRTFLELGGGGKDSLDALVRSQDVAVFTWSVRAFLPGDPREARVHLGTNGLVTGFRRTFAESDTIPAVSED
jgi:hypothetical protein